MRYRLFGLEKIGSENFAIVLEAIALIALLILLGLRAVDFWQLVPRHSRMGMMHEVKIVVEKEKGERTAVFDDHCSGRGMVVCAMLQKSANFQDSEAEIGRQPVSPDWDGRDRGEPCNHKGDAYEMREP